jgi:hypothetical protein
MCDTGLSRVVIQGLFVTTVVRLNNIDALFWCPFVTLHYGVRGRGVWTGFIGSVYKCMLGIDTHSNELLDHSKAEKLAQP